MCVCVVIQCVSPLCRSLSGIAKHQPKHNNWTIETLEREKARNALKHNLSAPLSLSVAPANFLYLLGLLGMLYGQLTKELPTRVHYDGRNDAVCVCFMEFSAHLKMSRYFHCIPTLCNYTQRYAQKVTLFPEFVHSIVSKVYISLFVSSGRVLFQALQFFGRHGNFWLRLCVCVCLPTNCIASEWNGNGSVAAANAIWYNLCLAVCRRHHTVSYLFMGGTLSTFDFIWVHFFFSPFNGYMPTYIYVVVVPALDTIAMCNNNEII